MKPSLNPQRTGKAGCRGERQLRHRPALCACLRERPWTPLWSTVWTASSPGRSRSWSPIPSTARTASMCLIPEGTFILGDVQKVSGFGQKRLAVVFHRMLMPDGYSVDLDQFHGLDQAGETGLKDKVNNHYLQIFGASIALGMIAGAAEATTNGGYNQSGSDMYRQGWRQACRNRARTCSTASSIFRRPSPSAKAIASRSISPRTCCCRRMRTIRFRPTSEARTAKPYQRNRASVPAQWRLHEISKTSFFSFFVSPYSAPSAHAQWAVFDASNLCRSRKGVQTACSRCTPPPSKPATRSSRPTTSPTRCRACRRTWRQRYKSDFSQWTNLSAPNTYGNTRRGSMP